MSGSTSKSAENPCVRQCIAAWDKPCLAAIDNDEDDHGAEVLAALVYREAMPPLVGVRNIRKYIACVAHGSVTGAIDIADSSRLLYRAQVALSTRRIRPPQEKASPSIQTEAIRSHFRATKSHSGAISRRRPCRLNPYSTMDSLRNFQKNPRYPPCSTPPPQPWDCEAQQCTLDQNGRNSASWA
jgi:hypothetical protein